MNCSQNNYFIYKKQFTYYRKLYIISSSRYSSELNIMNEHGKKRQRCGSVLDHRELLHSQ